ncbi:MAG: polysaccharide deacetylase family protein [Henriciella sp.]|nr:polysaccharide deacetylase family protein [Henriciella sp.]
MLDSSRYKPDRSCRAKVLRRLTQWRCAKPLEKTPKQAIVSFTFDDFPRSAAEAGAEALEACGTRGTFYVASSMARQTNLMGEMYGPDDLERLEAAGHEIASHTHLHLDCSRASPTQVLDELDLNRDALRAYGVTGAASQFAWPYGETCYEAKRALAGRVDTARGILPGINRKGADLMQLRAFELTTDEATERRAASAIRQATKSGGWVIVFTHDVRNTPSAFGTRPDVLRSLIRQARDSGAQILPVAQAYDVIRAS